MIGADPEWVVDGTLRGYDPFPRLQEIRSPTLVISGRYDRVTPPSVAQAIFDGLAPGRRRLHVFERSAHRPWAEQPDEYFELVGGFLRAEPQPRRSVDVCVRSARSESWSPLCAPVAAATADGPTVAAWRLAYASESPGRRGLDVYVAAVPGGRPRLVAGVAGRDDFGPAWSPDGVLIAYRLNPVRGDESDIMVVPARGGKPRNLTRSPGIADWSPAWSPDGHSIAFFSARSGGGEIWTMRPDGTRKRRLTNDGGLNEYPSWSPNGSRIAFQTARSGSSRSSSCPVTAASSEIDTAPGPRSVGGLVAGRRVDCVHVDARRQRGLFVIRPDGTGARNLTRTPGLEESHPSWSPTGELTFTRHAETGPIGVGRSSRTDATRGG